MIQGNLNSLFSSLQNANIDLIYLNVFMEKLSIYCKSQSPEYFISFLNKSNINYTIKNELTFIKIRFEQPDNLLFDIIRTVEILAKNNIPFLEIGLSSNRVYIIIENKYKNQFITLFDNIKDY